ncbi:MAG TPA: hypothetical protein VJY39_10455 [Acidisphaera sp.]|nr:hypothetical protein [Acidisphaera sp.]
MATWGDDRGRVPDKVLKGRVMALQLGALRDALLEAGVSEDKARKAAEEMAGYENRLASIDTRLSVLTWMAGTNIALTVAVLFKVFH